MRCLSPWLAGAVRHGGAILAAEFATGKPRGSNMMSPRPESSRPSTLEVPTVRKRSLSVVALLLALLAATAATAAPSFETVDAQLLDLAAAYPGFGGLFLDEAGRLNVYLTEPALRSGTMEKALG